MSTETYNKPIPAMDAPEDSPFWQAAREGRLVAQHCTNCGHWQYPALPVCAGCLEQSLNWDPVTPRGTIWSFATYHRAFHPGFKGDLPYTVGIIETPEGVRFTGRLLGDKEAFAVGAPVKVKFVAQTDDFTLPMWELAEED
jgi:uncharacterized OB-fold protein